MQRFIAFFLLLLPVFSVQGQFIFPCFPELKSYYGQQMLNHVSALANDSMEGREAGTEAEIKAGLYIADQFEQKGLKPYFGNSFLIPFKFNEGYEYASGQIIFLGKEYRLNDDYFFLNPSVYYNFNGKTVFAGSGLNNSDYAGLDEKVNKNVVIVLDINYKDSSIDIPANYLQRVESAVAKAAKRNPDAILLISSDLKRFPVPEKVGLDHDAMRIPVVGAGPRLSKKILKNKLSSLESECIRINNQKTAFNVAGWIDNGKPTTVVIGAHYDHLGYGSSGSLSIEKVVHNGADDNASGTAMMIELAGIIKDEGLNRHNYVFVAFSAEEKGLFGSNHFVKSMTGMTKTIAMINFDMVGRLDKDKPNLNIIGTGTATEWDSLIDVSDTHAMTIAKSQSGMGGSDQMSFYQEKIPVLFFITGIHGDYHKPTDDVEKINREGMVEILCFAKNIIGQLNLIDSLHFIETKVESSGRGDRSGVSLGIMPDHTWSGTGVRINAVSKDKPAIQAGLMANDVIIAIDSEKIYDIMTYMKVLSAYKKGDKAKITYLRGQIENTTEVVF